MLSFPIKVLIHTIVCLKFYLAVKHGNCAIRGSQNNIALPWTFKPSWITWLLRLEMKPTAQILDRGRCQVDSPCSTLKSWIRVIRGTFQKHWPFIFMRLVLGNSHFQSININSFLFSLYTKIYPSIIYLSVYHLSACLSKFVPLAHGNSLWGLIMYSQTLHLHSVQIMKNWLTNKLSVNHAP